MLYDDSLLDDDLERLLESASEEEMKDFKEKDEGDIGSGNDTRSSSDENGTSPAADPKQQQVRLTVGQNISPSYIRLRLSDLI